jgi:AcrR family transcriptional regulator
MIQSFDLNTRMIDTKQKILDAAERLIAEQGYAATSLRQIIGEAGVNLASVHYHFGSKEELLDGLVMRKVGAVNERRLEVLSQYESEAGGKPVPVVKILDAFLTPMGAVASKNPQFVRVMGRVVAEGLLPGLLEKNFQVVQVRFFGALRKALPLLPDEEFRARTHFMIGLVAHTMCGPAGPEGGFETWIGRMIRFLAGGFSAPAPKQGEGR